MKKGRTSRYSQRAHSACDFEWREFARPDRVVRKKADCVEALVADLKRSAKKKMKIRRISYLFAACLLLSGCQSALTLSGDVPVKALSGPYELRLTLDRNSAEPGELVYASIEFENTGSDILWIPRRREVFFGFEQKGPFHASSESWESSCDGLQFVRVKPGQKVKYEKGFAAPGFYGEVGVFITADRKVFAPLVVKKKEPNQTLQPTAPSGRG
jgi:hypothetical protein